MLATGYQMHLTAFRFPFLNDGEPVFGQDELGAPVNLGFRLPNNFLNLPIHLPQPNIKAELRVRTFNPSDPESRFIEFMVDTGQVIDVTPNSDQFCFFSYPFISDQRYEICIDFLATSSPTTSSPTTPPSSSHPVTSPSPDSRRVGFLQTELIPLRTDGHKRIPIAVVEDSAPHVAPTAQLKVAWPSIENQQLHICVRAKIQLSGGWPFSARRPFFLAYRLEDGNAGWQPFYLSEVLTQPTYSPDANGSMIFRIANFSLRNVIGNNDQRPLRFEFFHYKISATRKGQHELLGHCTTSLAQLRQATAGDRLRLVLNILPKGEIAGNLTLRESRVSSKRYYFSLQVNFGGPFAGRIVFFSITAVDFLHPRGGLLSRDTRLSFTISRYSSSTKNRNGYRNINNEDSTGKWVEVYHSQQSERKSNHRDHGFRVAKLTLSRLNGCDFHRIISINLHRSTNRGDPVLFAYLLTTLSTLLSEPRGSLFKLIVNKDDANSTPKHSDGPFRGYATLIAREQRDSRMSFSVEMTLGQAPPVGSKLCEL